MSRLFFISFILVSGMIFSQEISRGEDQSKGAETSLNLGSLDLSTNSEKGSATDTPQSAPAASTPSNADSSVPASAPVSNESEGNAATTSTKSSLSLMELVMAGGWIGHMIFLLSLIACTLVIQFALMFRKSVLIPADMREELARLVESGRIRQAIQRCQSEPSVYTRSLGAGLALCEHGWSEMQGAIEDSVAEETAAMYRKVEYLSVIGNIAPMLGLLGTVVGMVLAFGQLAVSSGMGRELAQGIYFALVTTVEGLIVAIPSLVAYALFNNRVAALSAELIHELDATIRPLRRGVVSSSSTVPPVVSRTASTPAPGLKEILP